MTYQELWHSIVPLYDPSEAQAIVRLVLDDAFGLSLADILCGGVEALPADSLERLGAMMRRLADAEPVQYVLGHAGFCGRNFAVGPGVLIPRPETEWIVERTAALLHGRGGGAPRVLDIGTGSGCIAVSIALNVCGAEVEAWDISPDALATARGNALRLGAGVEFSQKDALCPPHDCGQWDVIVSNPPYVCNCERAGMSANVLRHEPHTALFVPDADPLLFYRSIATYARTALADGGTLLFECNTRFAADTAQMLTGMGFAPVSVADDCFMKPRFVEAVKPHGATLRPLEKTK